MSRENKDKDIFERMKSSTGRGETTSSIIKHFLGDNVDTKTEIENPIGMSFFDLVALYCGTEEEQQMILERGLEAFKESKKGKTPSPTDYLLFFGDRVRVNFVSNQRKSRDEAVQVALGAKVEEEKRMKDRMLEGLGLR